MRELLLLFAVYVFFIISSVSIGFGVWLIDSTYAKNVAGSLIILSSLISLAEFYKTFGGK